MEEIIYFDKKKSWIYHEGHKKKSELTAEKNFLVDKK